ncbi:septum formation inhibitor Maf [Zeaxanthinibacter sp. PT1]|uniref:septum formation inhibitor Maf n=1 Tax=Zeaxanthinibacter TaxID=561554 RepID=UPI00234BE5BF|nr:septum formation inhibitor Maf [Zeaxanthinibacter sp. PT1]MDC6351353.1 septum formation inhibitor Maf [Zeaxanthinibacter sp. PT1]
MKKSSIPGALTLAAMYVLLFLSCKDQGTGTDDIAKNRADEAKDQQFEKPALTPDFKSYWFAGEAEISSYQLEQARYGELREGDAALIYVTEPFVKDKQVKADNSDPSNITVLKLNSTKNFLTGIYPYSIMTSTFYPLNGQAHALKVTNSVQEWCGQVFAQLNNRDKFQVNAYSYFESEGDQELALDKDILENEIWTQLRVDPESLPIGETRMIPSFEYLRLAHKELKAYGVSTSRYADGEHMVFELHYPELQRRLKIIYLGEFPYQIEGWTETYPSGFGDAAELMTSTAKKIKTMNIPYWQRNKNKDVILRDSLGL